MTSIRYETEQYYPMKDVFEQILGKASFMKVKNCGSITDWKAETVRLLKVVSLSINATVEIADEEWRSEIDAEIQFGISLVKSSVAIDELFAGLAATLAKVSFLQIGFIPRGHRNIKRIALTPNNWKLASVRSVQYVQNEKQRAMQNSLKDIGDAT